MISTAVFIPLVLVSISAVLIGISNLGLHRRVQAMQADIDRLRRDLTGDGR